MIVSQNLEVECEANNYFVKYLGRDPEDSRPEDSRSLVFIDKHGNKLYVEDYFLHTKEPIVGECYIIHSRVRKRIFADHYMGIGLIILTIVKSNENKVKTK